MIGDADILTFLYFLVFIFFLFEHLLYIFRTSLKKRDFFWDILEVAKQLSFRTMLRGFCFPYFVLFKMLDLVSNTYF